MEVRTWIWKEGGGTVHLREWYQKQFAICSIVEWVHNKGNIRLLRGKNQEECLGSGGWIVLLTPGSSLP